LKFIWDTHALIWGMEADPRLSSKAETIAGNQGNAISCISLWEIACLRHLGRLRFSIPIEQWLETAAERLQVLPITPAIAAAAYDLGPFHGDPADRIIAGTALVYGLPIVTVDKKLHECPKLECVWD